ncbi:hypothetical protein [Thalassobacillus sp. C254]|uniref:hypothetical protein n=1 Tax=Thalassobacillus sp. C254 TaxID=1225341 RepID=UPI0006D2A053|nr:hypothetical protein [Thalassobacillus sp. C254]
MKKEKEKKPFYKRWWFIVIAVIAFSGVVSSMNDDEEVATEEVEAEAEETASEEAIEENEDDSTTGEDNDVDNEETIEEEVNEEVEEEVVHEIPGTLGYDAEEFASRYNAASEELQVGWTIDEINVTEGEVQDVFQHQITPNVIINGTVNKADDSLREVTMIAQSDGSEDAAYDILFNMGLMIMATN